MAHNHSKDHHHHHDINTNIRTLKFVLSLTGVFFFVELAAGFMTNSLALLSDAGHMLSDVFTLVVSLYAASMSRRAPTAHKSYGYYRSEVLAALFNGLTLWLLIGFVYYEAFHRLFEPVAVKGSSVIFVGAAGLIVNMISAWMLHGHHDLNMKGAYLHVVMDAFGSVAAVLAGLLIHFTHWYPFDPLLSVVIGSLVLYSSWTLIRDSINILMESVPKHLDPQRIRSSVLQCVGVSNVHDLHIWSIGSKSHALSAHIVIPPQSDPLSVRNEVESVLREKFHLDHTTLQLEVQEGCFDAHD